MSFIRTPYDERSAFLTRLSREGFNVSVNGNWMWKDALAREGDLTVGEELYVERYCEAIWRSKMNLSFLTHSNQDEFAHKSSEVAACGGFLLAERSEGHLAKFEEDREAVFFSSWEECAEKIRRYLPDEDARIGIAQAGHARALRDDYDNNTQVRRIVQRLGEIR